MAPKSKYSAVFCNMGRERELLTVVEDLKNDKYFQKQGEGRKESHNIARSGKDSVLYDT